MSEAIPLESRPSWDDMTDQQRVDHPRTLLVRKDRPNMRAIVWSDDAARVEKWKGRGYVVITTEYDPDLERARRRVQIARARSQAERRGDTVVEVPRTSYSVKSKLEG